MLGLLSAFCRRTLMTGHGLISGGRMKALRSRSRVTADFPDGMRGMTMTDPFSLGTPGTPDGPPEDLDEAGRDALEARRRTAEAIMLGVSKAAEFMIDMVGNDQADPKDRLTAAKSLLSLAGIDRVTGRSGGPGSAGTDPLSAVDALLSGRPRSRWAASAVGKQKCEEPNCDWPVHRGGMTAHGHSVEAGYQDGCGFWHSMMDPCGPVPDGRSTRSNFWERQSK